jgi:MFS family permease
MILGYFGVIYVNWLFNAWLPGYLEMGRHMSIRHTGFVAAIPYIFAVAGGVSGGWLVDWLMRRGLSRVGSRKYPLCVAMLLEGIFVLVTAAVPSNTAAVACLCVAMFCGTVATTCAWAMVSVVAPANCTGSLGALQNFGGYLGGALAPMITGSFDWALPVGAGMCGFAAVAYFVIVRRPITPEDLMPRRPLVAFGA